MMDHDTPDLGMSAMWAIELAEPTYDTQQPKYRIDSEPTLEANPSAIPFGLNEAAIAAAAAMILRYEEDLPSDGIYRPRLGRSEDAA